jgi:drug/metabolite transporter (DMT)-like permease
MEVKIEVILLVLFCAFIATTGQIFFKLASKNFSLNPFTWIKNPYFILGGLLYFLGAALFVYALKFGNLSILYPIIATSYIWVVLFAHFLLGESFPAFKWIGILMIILGIGIIVR